VLIGFLLGFHHQPHLHCSSRKNAGAAINRCTSHVLSHLVLHWGLFLGGGLLVGGAVGLLAGLAIYPRRMRMAG
jgi:hypothetical protein